MKLFGIAGRKGHGKDTIADVIGSEFTVVRRAFADPMRRAVGEIFGLSHELMTDRQLKETYIPFWEASPRQIMQRFGTEAVRDVMGSDVWVKRAELELETILAEQASHPLPAAVVIFTDVRFANEAEFIHRNGGIVIEVHRPNHGTHDVHSSEQPLPRALVNSMITNDQSLEAFAQTIKQHYLAHWLETSGELRSKDERRVA